MRDSRHWLDFPLLLADAMPAERVVCLDLPGSGSRWKECSPSHIGALVDDCRAQLAMLGVRPPLRLLAVSLGGLIAIEWATRYPSDLKAAVLVNTSLRSISSFHLRLRWTNYPMLARMLLGSHDLCLRERCILELTSNHAQQREMLLPTWLAMQRARPMTVANAMRQLLAAARYLPPDRAPQVPMLLLGSREDRLVDISCTLAIARHWALPCRLHENAGHDLPLDDPQWVVDQVRTWIVTSDGKAIGS
jgi:pimeloyl-ACP methyl ester carboxylesterase